MNLFFFAPDWCKTVQVVLIAPNESAGMRFCEWKRIFICQKLILINVFAVIVKHYVRFQQSHMFRQHEADYHYNMFEKRNSGVSQENVSGNEVK